MSRRRRGPGFLRGITLLTTDLSPLQAALVEAVRRERAAQHERTLAAMARVASAGVGPV